MWAGQARRLCPKLWRGTHLAVSQALMLVMSSGSLEAEAGLHFQLPPTIGRRDIILLAEESDERRSVGVARSIFGDDWINYRNICEFVKS